VWLGKYAKVDSILSAKGDVVFHPTLTGLMNGCVFSQHRNKSTTHITTSKWIKFETDLILVDKKQGGMVISGVAEQVPDRNQQLI
jgi:hypothetical protein